MSLYTVILLMKGSVCVVFCIVLQYISDTIVISVNAQPYVNDNIRVVQPSQVFTQLVTIISKLTSPLKI